jgi:hypothetical protein
MLSAESGPVSPLRPYESAHFQRRVQCQQSGHSRFRGVRFECYTHISSLEVARLRRDCLQSAYERISIHACVRGPAIAYLRSCAVPVMSSVTMLEFLVIQMLQVSLLLMSRDAAMLQLVLRAKATAEVTSD